MAPCNFFCAALCLFGIILHCLGKRETSEPALKPCFLAPSALVALREELQSIARTALPFLAGRNCKAILPNSRMKNGKAVHSDAKSALGCERQVPKSLKNQGLRVFRVLREQIFCRRKGNFCSNMGYCKKISRSECGYLPLKTEFGCLPLAYPQKIRLTTKKKYAILSIEESKGEHTLHIFSQRTEILRIVRVFDHDRKGNE